MRWRLPPPEGGASLHRTRRSLFYLAGYLLPSGLALVVAPATALRLLMATGDYGTVMPRFLGFVLVGLGAIVVDIIRLRAEPMYPSTMIARVPILAGIVLSYAQTGDLLFLSLLAVVGFGFLFTLSSYLLDRRAHA